MVDALEKGKEEGDGDEGVHVSLRIVEYPFDSVRHRHRVVHDIALPETQYGPTTTPQRRRYLPVPVSVSRELLQPPILSLAAHRLPERSFVPFNECTRVPEVRIDEDGDATTSEDQVRFPGEIPHVQSITATSSPELSTQGQLGLCISGTDTRHHPASNLGGPRLVRPLWSGSVWSSHHFRSDHECMRSPHRGPPARFWGWGRSHHQAPTGGPDEAYPTATSYSPWY
jgi:hypothetical protein